MRERIYTEEPLVEVWRKVFAFTSIENAKRLIEKDTSQEERERKKVLINEKAEGLAFCLRTARDYFSASDEQFLTSCAVSYYYGLVSLVSALLLADLKNSITIKDIEKYFESGHGVNIIPCEEETFPFSEYNYIAQDGFLAEVLRKQAVNMQDVVLTKKEARSLMQNKSKSDKRLISLVSLLARIPEIIDVYCDCFNRHPFCARVQTDNNYYTFFEKYQPRLTKNDLIEMLPDEMRGKLRQQVYEEEESIRLSITTLEDSEREKLSCCLANSPTHELVFISYFPNIPRDLLLYHFIILHWLSITARYRPSLWRSVLEGNNDRYKVLFEAYLGRIKRVIPHIFLRELTGRVYVFAQMSYWS